MTRARLDNSLTVLAMLALGWVAGCDSSTPQPPPALTPSNLDTGAGDAEVGGPQDSSNPTMSTNLSEFQFADDVQSNRADDGTIGELEFVDTHGERVRLDQYRGKKNVLLVFTRGFSGQLCPFCTTQTSRLIANYDKFIKRDTEVLLVYPGQKDQLGEFRAASLKASGEQGFPFPVLLDEDLAAVNRLDIAAQLAFPSTFIIDKQGRVTLSYVGESPTDRPSIKALLTQLDSLQK